MTLRSRLTPLLVFAMVAKVSAQPSPPPEARQHSDACIKAYDLAEYQRAINECKAAYELYPAPLLLYSIAQANRKLGQAATALEFYKKYIAKSPTGSQRAQAENQIELLKPIVEAAERSRTAPPDGAGADQTEHSGSRRPGPVAAAPSLTVSQSQVANAPPVAGEVSSTGSRPKSRRWIWGVVVGSVVVAGLGIGLGVGLAPRSVSYPSATTTAGSVQW